jgi:hypothetical protein
MNFNKFNYDERIVFVNEPIVAVVEEKTKYSLLCYPFIYKDGFCSGVGIVFDDGCMIVWTSDVPCDFVAAWRATEILRRLQFINQETLCFAYRAAEKKFSKLDKPEIMNIIVQIGNDNYDKIMELPVPEEIMEKCRVIKK